jgi:hypothetical protein
MYEHRKMDHAASADMDRRGELRRGNTKGESRGGGAYESMRCRREANMPAGALDHRKVSEHEREA